MQRIDTFRIEKCNGNGSIGAACRLAIFLPGVRWSNLNIAATELSVIYDDHRITLPSIIAALNSIGFSILFLSSPAMPTTTIIHPVNRIVRHLSSSKKTNKFIKDQQIQVSGMTLKYNKIL